MGGGVRVNEELKFFRNFGWGGGGGRSGGGVQGGCEHNVGGRG